MRSRLLPPVLTVETFLRSSAGKLLKPSHIRSRWEENHQESGVEVPRPQIRVPSRTPLKLLNHKTSALKTRGRSSAKVRRTSCLTNAAGLAYSSEEVDTRLPLDLGPVLDLDFPLLKLQKSKQWNPMKPLAIDFSRASSSFNHFSPTTGDTVGFRPITHWRTNEPPRGSEPFAVASNKRKEITSRQRVLPLQFVPWEKHEEGILELKACRLG